jgi:hypothetical protein
MHKTGTTSIQHFLYRNQELLNQLGLLYPTEHTFGRAHHEIAKYFWLEEGLPDFALERYGNRANWEKVVAAQKRQLIETQAQKCLLSSEAFGLCSYQMVFDYYKEFDIKIIIFLRRQDMWLESTLNQKLKMYHDYGSISHSHIQSKEERLDYFDLLNRFADVFGFENLIVVPFKKSSDTNGLETNFLRLIDIECNDNFVLEPPKNTRLSRDCINYLSALPEKNRIRNPKFGKLVELLQLYSKLHPSNPEHQHFYSPQKRLEIVDKYRQSNMRVAKDFLGIESGELFDEPEPSLDDPWEPYTGLSKSQKDKITDYLKDNGATLNELIS